MLSSSCIRVGTVWGGGMELHIEREPCHASISLVAVCQPIGGLARRIETSMLITFPKSEREKGSAVSVTHTKCRIRHLQHFNVQPLILFSPIFNPTMRQTKDSNRKRKKKYASEVKRIEKF